MPTLIDKTTPKSFAARYGGDPVYMRPPNEKFDGYMFYNFGSGDPEFRTVEWLTSFIAAIERTIKAFRGKKHQRDLGLLKQYVQSLIKLQQLDAFTRAYIIAALWSSTDTVDGVESVELDSRFDVSDFAPETLQKCIDDCKKFRDDNASDLTEAYQRYSPRGDCYDPEELAGHDFWLTRAHHGVGFWDRRELSRDDDLGDILTAAAQKFREVNLIVGDDGKLYME